MVEGSQAASEGSGDASSGHPSALTLSLLLVACGL